MLFSSPCQNYSSEFQKFKSWAFPRRPWPNSILRNLSWEILGTSWPDILTHKQRPHSLRAVVFLICNSYQRFFHRWGWEKWWRVVKHIFLHRIALRVFLIFDIFDDCLQNCIQNLQFQNLKTRCNFWQHPKLPEGGPPPQWHDLRKKTSFLTAP